MENESKETESNVIHGSIVIFTRGEGTNRRFLIFDNAKSGNVTFVSGGQEPLDKSNTETAAREITEEINLNPDDYNLTKSNVHQEFIFNQSKPERAGKKGDYQVFIADLKSPKQIIQPTNEVKSAVWLTKEEILESKLMPDLATVLEQVIEEQSW